MKLIFLAPVAAIAITGTATGAYFWLTAEGTVEEAPLAQQEASPTPTPDATPAQEPTPTPTTPDATPVQKPTPTPAPALAQPSPQPVPADWLTYTDAETGVTLRYPPDWVAAKTLVSSSYGVYAVRVYKPVTNPAPKDQFSHDAAYPPPSASVSLTDCCLPGFLELYACDRPTEKTTVSGYPADRCVYTKENPPPGGYNFPNVGANILYTVHAPGKDLYLGIVLHTVDDTGTVILDTWNSEDAEEAERIVQTLEIAP